MRLFEFFEYNGRLAISYGESVDQDAPIQIQKARVSRIPASHEPALIGQIAELWNSNLVVRGIHGNLRPVDSDNWDFITIETPIAPPRDGKTYTWNWRNSEWRKVEFPRCGDCPWGRSSAYHNPTLEHCEICGEPVTPAALRKHAKEHAA